MATISNNSQNQFDSQTSIDLKEKDEAQAEILVDAFLANAREQILQELKTIRDKNFARAEASLTLKCESATSRELDEPVAAEVAE